MKVERVSLRNFRNIGECSLQPDGGLNVFIGRNGQGKTSILEALGYLANLRSFRGSKSAEVMRWGESSSEIACTVTPGAEGPSAKLEDWRTELKVAFNTSDPTRQKTAKIAFINGKPYRSSTQYLSQRFGSYRMGFHAVVFNPSDHDLVRGEPTARRSYIDRVLAAENVDYLKTFQKYQRLLEQRNAILKSHERPMRDLLAGFSEPFGRLAAELSFKRLEWIKRVGPQLDAVMQQIAPQAPSLRLVSVSNWVPEIAGLSLQSSNLGPLHFAGHEQVPSLEILEQAFWKRLSDLETAEWRTGHSLVGPHRDDWTFFLGSQILKGHGSQGEVRSALLALKLAEIELFRKETGHRPIFLLDDFSSELDRERRAFLLKYLSGTDLQVFVSTTEDFGMVGRWDGKRFRVSDGSLTEVSHDHRTDSNQHAS